MAEEVRPRAPLFFLSYARPSGRQRMSRFFDDLTENVDQLVGRPVGADPGFMDTHIPGGNLWPPDLLAAVGRCQVFIAMLSSPYITRPWCGREWFAFAQRMVTPVADGDLAHPTAILPVLWAPVPRERAPQVVRKVEWFSPSGLTGLDIPELYAANGVFGLMVMGLETPYQTVVWEIAKTIRDIYYGCHVEPLVLREEQLHDAFREGGS